jgi:hypothetical protein
LNKKFAAVAIALLMIIGMIPALSIPRATAQETCELYGDSPMCVFLHPGVADAYKIGWSHTLDTLWSTQDTGTPYSGDQPRQVFDNYLDYAILAKSVGDLQFDFSVMVPIGWIEIYVPPEFTWLGPSKEESIWTDITNDYQFIWTTTMSDYDIVAPGWTRVLIGLDQVFVNSMTIEPNVYHVRLFNLQAPEAAGLYHFKIYVGHTGGWDGSQAVSIGAGNFPFTIVKTELNPAYAQVVIRTHAFGGPDVGGNFVSGWVHAEGTTPEGRTVDGVGYFGPNEFMLTSVKPGEFGALYQVYLFGLAAGTYTFTAEASGFNQGVAERVAVEAGQSIESVFILLYDSPDVSVTVVSKHGTGEIPWNNLWQLPFGTNDPAAPPSDEGPRRDIMLELYNADNNLIGWWASNEFDTKRVAETNKLLGLHDEGATMPESTTYSAVLTDNEDLVGNPRGTITHNPSTHWDGHVPWDTADYIAGMPNGQYTVEAYVTGYVMDEPDAYQRTFTSTGINTVVSFDLRRSNWIEVSMHAPSGIYLLYDTTVTLTAEDAEGNERGAATFTATPDMSADSNFDGTDAVFATARTPNWEYYTGGIVIEGWNGIFPNVGSSVTRGDSQARDPKLKDYGLNPTAATHSAGAVSLAGNPYSIKLYMADMGVPWEGVAGSGWYNIVGDQVVSVFLCNSPASLSFTILNAYLMITLRSVDFEVPAHSRPWTFPGSEIWIAFKDAEGNSITTNPVLDPTLYGLIQDPDGVTPFDIDNVNDVGKHELLQLYYYGSDWCNVANPFQGNALIRASDGKYRSWFLPAGQVSFDVYTHGYIMRRSFPVQIPFSGAGNIQADLIQGGQIRVLLEFRHEGEVTAFNGFVRVEVFNEAGELVGANVYGQAEPNVYTQTGNGGAYLTYQDWADHMVVQGPAAATGFGLGFPSSSGEQRAFTSSVLYGAPAVTWAQWSMTTPSDANRIDQFSTSGAGGMEYFDVYGFYWYHGDVARTWAGGWPTVNTYGAAVPNPWIGDQFDSGIRGTVDVPGWSGSGGGTYTVKIWAFDPRGPDDMFRYVDPITGATEGADDDWRMYSMGWELTGIQLPWGGAQELFMTMNNMASLRGTVRWFDLFGNLRALPWAEIRASPGPTTDSVPAYSAGYGGVGESPSNPAGGYIMWLPAGTHDVSVSTSEAPQVWTSGAPTSNMDYTVAVSDGWVGGADTQLAESGTPVPELPSFVAPLALFAALAASVWLLRKRTINVPVLMK